MADDNKKMTPKEYHEYLKSVDLVSIRFSKYNVKSNKKNIESEMNIDVKYKTSYEIEPNDTMATATIAYTLKAYKKFKKNFVLQIECVMEVVLESRSSFNEDFLDIYLDVNLNYNAWPYFREFVQDTAQRIGIPPLTLPFYKP